MRTTRAQGACLLGAEAKLVTVEARFEPANQKRTEVQLSGLPDPIIRESRGRLLSALEAIGLGPGGGRLFLNLVPAGMKKSGEILDLPMAMGAAAAAGHLDPRALRGFLFLGEVGIDGRLHAVPGGLAVADRALRAGLSRIVAPPATAREAAALPGIRAFAAEDLGEAVALVLGVEPRPRPLDPPAPLEAPDPGRDLDAVRGQESGKRALVVAAAGGHDLLLVGPPGTGKSLLARALVELLPVPDRVEQLEVTRILSAVGRWPGGLASSRPFRAPHHTTSYAGLVGGGNPPAAGEITLAHRGVLFLDELPEFRREALEALRQPLESGRVHIARAGRQLDLPAAFQLVCAMNPCPCGYRGHPRLACRCSPFAVERYRQRISGPLLDRIDLRLELPAPSVDELSPPRGTPQSGPTALELADKVRAARERMITRQAGRSNATLEADALDRWAPLDGGLRPLIESAVHRRGLSARAVQSLRRVARTLADLAGRQHIGLEHLAEALALRCELPG